MDTHFWEAVCFIIFILLVYKPAKNFLMNYLSEHSDNVRNTMKDAQELREHSEKVIAFYKKQHDKFSSIVDEMYANTAENIERVTQNMDEKLKKIIDKKTNLHEERLVIYKDSETRKIKAEVVKKALVIVENYLTSQGVQKVQKYQIDEILDVTKNQKIKIN